MIGKRSKREPPTPSVGKNSDPLTPSTSLKIGEYFVVLRRAPHKGGFIEEKCIATIVEIRDGEEIESPGDQSTTVSTSYEKIADSELFCLFQKISNVENYNLVRL